MFSVVGAYDDKINALSPLNFIMILYIYDVYDR